MTDSRRLRAGRRAVEISHPGKVLFPDDGITKWDLALYYLKVAPAMLPHLDRRPLSFERFPDGIDADGFFQKDVPGHFPRWIGRARLRKVEGEEIDYVVAGDAATLAYLASQACITMHAGLSRTDRPDRPDRMIFDLDPSSAEFAPVQRTARRLKSVLDGLDLPTFVMATGSRGLHVVVPLDRSATFEAVRTAARALATSLARRHPDEVTVEQRKEKRGNRVFVDWLRNAYGQTAVAPYSVRARPGAPVAAPLTWREALSGKSSPRRYTVRNLFRRLAQRDDPWSGIRRAAIRADSLGARVARLPG